MQNPGTDMHYPAVAFLTVPGGSRVAVCKRDLDWWLDDADDGITVEPAALDFLPWTLGTTQIVTLRPTDPDPELTGTLDQFWGRPEVSRG